MTIVVSLPLAFTGDCVFHNPTILKIKVTHDSGSELNNAEEQD